MGFERTALYKKIEFDLELSGSILFTFATERPGEALTVRVEKLLPATNGRDTITVGLPDSKGHLYRVKLGGTASVARIFGARVYAKALDGSSKTAWQWYPIPLEPTSPGWQTMALPIPPTAAGFTTFGLPIPPTAAGFTTFGLPMRDSPPRGTWLDLPLDQ